MENSVYLSPATQRMDTNPIKTAITVCSDLIQKKVTSKLMSTHSVTLDSMIVDMVRNLIVFFTNVVYTIYSDIYTVKCFDTMKSTIQFLLLLNKISCILFNYARIADHLEDVK